MDLKEENGSKVCGAGKGYKVKFIPGLTNPEASRCLPITGIDATHPYAFLYLKKTLRHKLAKLETAHRILGPTPINLSFFTLNFLIL